jgi:hypothetical protein
VKNIENRENTVTPERDDDSSVKGAKIFEQLKDSDVLGVGRFTRKPIRSVD